MTFVKGQPRVGGTQKGHLMHFPLTEQQQMMLLRDMADFVRGKKRFFAVKRWIETQTDEMKKRRVAVHIADLFLDRYLDPKE